MAFFIPFGFIFDQAILFEGDPLHIALVSVGLLASTALWAVALGGHVARPLTWAERGVLGVLGLTAVLFPTGSLPWGIALGAGAAACAIIWRSAPAGEKGRMARVAPSAE